MFDLLTRLQLWDDFLIKKSEKERERYVCQLSPRPRSFLQLQCLPGPEPTGWPHSLDLHFPSSHFPSHSSVDSTNKKLRRLQQTNIYEI